MDAEKNFLRYALFVSFFPQLIAGPIERSKNLLVQLRQPHSFSYENLRKGALLILYGLFLKMVIADRAAVIVDTVYQNSGVYPGFFIAVATIFFSIQIYCDFYGYSTIARGSALIMGIRLMDNFNAPYFSRSVKEFWRRWHISLSGWFRDYLYIPLGGNRRGKLKKEKNLLAVFAVSGLWHGASLAFVFWGILNGVYQVIEDVVEDIKAWLKKYLQRWQGPFEKREDSILQPFSRKLFQTVLTFLLITFAWLFFRAGELDRAIGRLAGMFRVSGIMLLLFTILLYGCYGELYDVQQFIYFQF